MITLIASTVDIRGNLASTPGAQNIQTDLGVIIGSFVGLAILLAGIGALAYMILGATKWVSAGGDKGKIEKAQSMITQSVVGLGLTAAIYALFGIVQYFFGINILG